MLSHHQKTSIIPLLTLAVYEHLGANVVRDSVELNHLNSGRQIQILHAEQTVVDGFINHHPISFDQSSTTEAIEECSDTSWQQLLTENLTPCYTHCSHRSR